MESGNKVVGLALVVLVAGAAGFFGRNHFAKILKNKSESAPVAGKSLVTGGRVIVEAFGKPYISEDALNQKLEQMLQSSPSTRGMDVSLLPPVAKVGFLKDWINFLLIKDVWGKEKDFAHDAVFQKRLAEGIEALTDSLIVDSFVQDLKKNVVVSSEEIGVEYHSNKDQYLKAPAGAICAVVEYSDEAAAQNLVEKASKVELMSDFQALADSVPGGTFMPLGFVGGQGSGRNSQLEQLPMEVRYVVSEKHDQHCQLVSVDASHYVIFMADRKPARFKELDDASPEIASKLEEMKHRNALEAALEDLRTKANLVVNTEIFGAQKRPQPRVLSKQELAQAIQEEEASSSNYDDVDNEK